MMQMVKFFQASELVWGIDGPPMDQCLSGLLKFCPPRQTVIVDSVSLVQELISLSEITRVFEIKNSARHTLNSNFINSFVVVVFEPGEIE